GDLELHVYYGFDNIDKLLASGATWAKHQLGGVKEKAEALLKQPGVTHHGRVSQDELYLAWRQSGLCAYPTDFTETSCITCMEAQSLGAVPVTRPLWALADNVRHGIFIEGSPTHDPLVRARYVGEIVRLVSDPELQDKIRVSMMSETRSFFNWERW